MNRSIYSNYLETKVLSSHPLELVAILYGGAIDAVGMALQHLRAGAVAERSRKITLAWEILHELRQTLDHERAQELSTRLSALYLYMQERLLEANTTQTEAPLVEVHKYLSELHGAWQTIGKELHVQTEHVPVEGREPLSVAC